jgi:hypothetical protein
MAGKKRHSLNYRPFLLAGWFGQIVCCQIGKNREEP